jgi:hypothetical protein
MCYHLLKYFKGSRKRSLKKVLNRMSIPGDIVFSKKGEGELVSSSPLPLAVHPSASGYTAVMFKIGWYDLCLILCLT